ncbi:hypothetical protein T10_12019 [Trichinella papuae]|uniref:Uncharacterized protein n=1 Tax=Trichinella papuae TaxID=268474 RepID=A0A0V1MME6_9BILA|nr:hypothetical protein T10_12019 [Trichinella papuae]
MFSLACFGKREPAQEMANWPGQGDRHSSALFVTKQQPLPTNIQAVTAWIVLLNVVLLPPLVYSRVAESKKYAGSMLAISSFKEILKPTTQPLVAFGQKRIAQAPLVTDVELWNVISASGLAMFRVQIDCSSLLAKDS